MAQAQKANQKVVMRILALDPQKINDPALLNEWDLIWAKVNEMRVAINRARQSNQTITVQLMQEYEQARNTERQFFWDNFYQQHEVS